MDSKDRIKKFLKKEEKIEISKPSNENNSNMKQFIEERIESNIPKVSRFPKLNEFIKNFPSIFSKTLFLIPKTTYRKIPKWMKESFPMFLFFSFSTYIVYKMEVRISKLNERVNTQKSLKQVAIEEEANELASILNDKPLVLKPIDQKESQEANNIYRHSSTNSWDELNTKDIMLEGIAEEYLQGIPIADELKDDVMEFLKRRDKKRKISGIYKLENDEN